MTCAAALATLDEIAQNDLLANCTKMGARLRDGLLALQEEFPAIGEVRGMGLMQALELVGPGKAPDAALVGRVFEATRELGLLIGKGGLYGNVIRLTPMLNVTAEELDQGLAVLRAAFRAVH